MLLVGLSIDIANGTSADLKVYKGEQVEAKCQSFCKDQNLDLKIASILVIQIGKILEAKNLRETLQGNEE